MEERPTGYSREAFSKMFANRFSERRTPLVLEEPRREMQFSEAIGFLASCSVWLRGLNQISRLPDIQLEMISKVPLFANLGKKHLEAISGIGKRLSYDPGHKIVKKGEKGIGFYLIIDGRVEVRSGDKVLAKLSKGNFFGEMALLEKEPRSADVVAIAPTTCFGITGWSFEEILKKEPEIASGIIKELAHRLRAANAALTE